MTLQALLVGCDAEFTQVHCAVGSALKRLIDTFITPSAVAEAVAWKTSPGSKPSPTTHAVLKFISQLESLIALKYQQTWLYVLDALRLLYSKVPRPAAPSILGEMTLRMAGLYEGLYCSNGLVSAGHQVYVFDALGAILRSIGLAHFLALVPLVDKKRGTLASKEWLLYVLQSNVKLMPCELDDFLGLILPVARSFAVASADAKDEATARAMRSVVLHLWGLFPGLCFYGPTDVPSALPRLVPSLEKAMLDAAYPEISSCITAGLSQLIHGAAQTSSPASLEALKRATPTLLPAALKLMESLPSASDSRHTNCLQCIEALARIASPALVGAVSKKLIEMLLTAAGDEGEDAAGWLSILLALIPHIRENLVVLAYRTVRPMLAVKEAAQKRAYLVFDALLRHHGAVVQAYEPRLHILALLSQYLLTCSLNARHMRLRCMCTLLSTLEEQVDVDQACSRVLPEVLLCMKDCNKKTRTGAREVFDIFLNRVAQAHLVALLSEALQASISTMQSSGVVACCMFVLSRRSDSAALRVADNWLSVILPLTLSGSGEVAKAVLGYLRVCASVLPAETLEGVAPELIDACTCCIGGPLKAKFSARVRAVLRKLSQRIGEACLRPYMYYDD